MEHNDVGPDGICADSGSTYGMGARVREATGVPERIQLRGLDLRYATILLLEAAGVPLTLGEIIDELEARGFCVGACRINEPCPMRPDAAKVLADALRWEVRRGRVRRVGRGLYAGGPIHRSSHYRARTRLAALRAAGPA